MDTCTMTRTITPAKRILDLVIAIFLALILWPLLLILIVLLWATEGRPVFYIAERMQTPSRGFGLIKLRTMRPLPDDAGRGVTGGDKSARMSRLHRLLRRSRADELPQLWNVIRGDMSLVGPRPPLRSYVEAYPELYAQVLRNRPGITGLASLHFHAHEERLLAPCATADETDAVYRRRCIPRKARIDLIYQRQQSLCLDLMLIGKTAARPFRRGT
jgi:lipopolysaccharide/colanic/teichoic acid biosynthesis glycosyltransferase